MTEPAAGVGVARGVALEVRVALGAMVVGELENALAIEATLTPLLVVRALGVLVVAEEVESKVRHGLLYGTAWAR